MPPVRTLRQPPRDTVLHQNPNRLPSSHENRILRARKGDVAGDKVYVTLRAMKYLAKALKQLDIPFAVTGSLVGHEYRIERIFTKEIKVVLLSHGTHGSVKMIENALTGVSFDGHHVFTRRGKDFCYFDDRVPYKHTRLFCNIELISFPKLSAAEKLKYSRLSPSRQHGWLTTSPVLVLLNALADTGEIIGRTAVNSELDEETSKKLHSLRRMIRVLSPGEGEDQRLLGPEHVKYLRLLTWRMPEVATYLPFKPYIKEGSIGRVTRSSRQNTALSSKAAQPVLKQQFSRFPLDASPIMKSLHYILRQISTWFANIASLGVEFAVGGRMASAMYGVQKAPQELDLILFVSPSTPIPGDVVASVKQFIRDQDSSSFKLQPDGTLCFAPSRVVCHQIGFNAKSFTNKRCIINIKTSDRLELPHLASAQCTIIEGLPVIPFELHLLYTLGVWDLCRQQTTAPRNAWKTAARDVSDLLDASYSLPLSTAPMWKNVKVVRDGYEGICKRRVKEFVSHAPGGQTSVPAWIRLGLLSAESDW